MQIDLPTELESAVKAHANAHGLSVAGYVRSIVERDLTSLDCQPDAQPFKTGQGSFAKYGNAPSAEEIESNRSEMFKSFGEQF